MFLRREREIALSIQHHFAGLNPGVADKFDRGQGGFICGLGMGAPS